ncbi:ATP-binding protein [Sporomusa malonica]|uniref:Uncharacterized protein n=1 Tax=Sporomusa malonica TaxID=112901 RepID=A0A1W2ESV9_9FIRM|nr:ATP-binding protein [Sporomusa malonica]SMD12725.1 hypothetical protein SAMN04488500_12933 [Sporomusa malonica]
MPETKFLKICTPICLRKDEAYVIVKDIYNTTIFTDIVKRNQFRKIDQLERVVKYAFDNIGNTFSANSIKGFLTSQSRSIDVETIYNYLSKLESAYILNGRSRQATTRQRDSENAREVLFSGQGL